MQTNFTELNVALLVLLCGLLCFKGYVKFLAG